MADTATQNDPSIAERSLLLRHVDGDGTAFADLLRRWRAPVYGYLVRSGLDRPTCDDLFQEIFLRVHAASRSYDSSRPLAPWIFAIVVNTVRSHFRKARVRRIMESRDEVPEVPDPGASGLETAEAHETAAFFDSLLQKLSPSRREVVLLVCVEHLEQKDVARILGIPVGTVKTHLSRARTELARAWARTELSMPLEETQ